MNIFLAILFTLQKEIVSGNELPIILSLIKNFEIRQCFFVNEGVNFPNSLSGKKRLLKSIATAYINFEKLIKYLENTEFGDDGTGIILKENNLARIEEMSQNFDLVSTLKTF